MECCGLLVRVWGMYDCCGFLVISEHVGSGCGGGGCGCVCLCPFMHFLMAACGDGACEWCFDEVGCESEEFLVCVFVDVIDDLLGGE